MKEKDASAFSRNSDSALVSAQCCLRATDDAILVLKVDDRAPRPAGFTRDDPIATHASSRRWKLIHINYDAY